MIRLFSLLSLLLLIGPVRAQVCEGDVIISDGAALDSFDCEEIEGDLLIEFIEDAEDLGGMLGLRSISGNLEMYDSPAVTALYGLDSLGAIGGDLIVGDNYGLLSLAGIEALETVGGRVLLYDNFALSSIEGLRSLTRVGGHLTLSSLNQTLVSLDGLESLREIGGYLSLYELWALEDITALAGLEFIRGAHPSQGHSVIVRYNRMLADCTAGLGALLGRAEFPGTVSLYGNAEPGACNSLEDILATESEPAPVPSLSLRAYPNPAADRLRLDIGRPLTEGATAAVFDALGREVMREEVTGAAVQIALDVSSLPAGLYVARLVVRERVETASFSVVR